MDVDENLVGRVVKVKSNGSIVNGLAISFDQPSYTIRLSDDTTSATHVAILSPLGCTWVTAV